MGYPCVSLSGLSSTPGSMTDSSCPTGRGLDNVFCVVDQTRCDWYIIEQSGNMFASRALDNGLRPIDIQDQGFKDRGYEAASSHEQSKLYGVPCSRPRSYSLYVKQTKLKDRSDNSSMTATFHSFRCKPLKLKNCTVTNPTGITPPRRQNKPWNQDVLPSLYDEYGKDWPKTKILFEALIIRNALYLLWIKGAHGRP